jgi:hypothetical protein
MPECSLLTLPQTERKNNFYFRQKFDSNPAALQNSASRVRQMSLETGE